MYKGPVKKQCIIDCFRNLIYHLLPHVAVLSCWGISTGDPYFIEMMTEEISPSKRPEKYFYLSQNFRTSFIDWAAHYSSPLPFLVPVEKRELSSSYIHLLHFHFGKKNYSKESWGTVEITFSYSSGIFGTKMFWEMHRDACQCFTCHSLSLLLL